MKINLMTDYAVRVIRCIYENEKGIVTSNNMSQTEGIPHGVLMKVLRQLREKGIVLSHQGRGEVSGGYTLGKSVKEITMLEIIELMEGAIMLENLRNKGNSTTTDVKEDAILREYQRVSQILRSEMKRNSLYEILNEGRMDK
jgi:Predicted transcriptional regulator